MFPDQCTAYYTRALPGADPQHLRCTYIADHPVRHSFETLKAVDDAEFAERRATRNRAALNAPVAALGDLATVVERIRGGALDECLELVLAEAHDRKRTLRGVTGFPRQHR